MEKQTKFGFDGGSVMTRDELRKEHGYIEAYNKIKNYPQGFRFTIYYSEIPEAKCRALEIILDDCEKEGLIESVAIGIGLDLERKDETFVRL